MLDAKNCINCNKVIHGRADKKFCDDSCRNNYNNQIKGNVTNTIRNINNTLSKNRRILEEFLQNEEMIKATKDKLIHAGFQFKYHTHTYTNKKGNIYNFCYEYGYLLLEHDLVLIVKRKEA